MIDIAYKNNVDSFENNHFSTFARNVLLKNVFTTFDNSFKITIIV